MINRSLIIVKAPLISFLAAWIILASAGMHNTQAAETSPLPPRQCKPLIRGALWWIHPKTDAKNLNRTLDAMQDVGMDVLWLLGTTPLVNDSENDLLEQVFTQADRRGWRVIIETSGVGNWYQHWDIPALKKLELKQIGLVAQRYGHHPSFFGWYINYEIYMEWDEKSRKIRDLYRYIGETTKRMTPKAKLTISPFFLADKDHIRGGFRYGTPEEYGDWWRETIRQAGIDIVMLQDSGAVHCECVPFETRAAFFSAMQQACKANGAELWGNVETVEHRAKDWQEYATRLKHYREGKIDYPWSFDMKRNAAKLDFASRFSSNIVTWGWEFWNPVAPQDKVGHSADNYNAYRAYYRELHEPGTSTTTSPTGMIDPAQGE